MTNTGPEELLLQLKDLEAKVSGNLMRKALRAGSKICAAQMRADAPVVSGATRDAIKVKAMKRSRNRVGMAVSVGMGWFKGTTFYAGFVEFGHKIGKRPGKAAIRAGLDKRAKVEGTHWMLNAFNKSEPAAAEKIYETLKAGLDPKVKEGGA